MKNVKHLLLASLLACPLVFAAEDHAHGHQHAEHHDDHHHVTKGPNGGLVVRAENLIFEVAVDAKRMARIVFLDKELKALASGGHEVSGVVGPRSAPVKLGFAKSEDGKSLIADQALPVGEHLPVVLSIKTGADAKAVTARFELHLH